MSFGWASSMLSCVQSVVPVAGLLIAPLVPSAIALSRFAGLFCTGDLAGKARFAATGVVRGEGLGDGVPPGKVRSAGFADRMRSEVQYLATASRYSALVAAVLTETAGDGPEGRLVRSPPGIAAAESVTTVAVAKPAANTKIRRPMSRILPPSDVYDDPSDKCHPRLSTG
jgi:hypothetical protein